MADPWNHSGPSGVEPEGVSGGVTLVEGSSFVIASRSGDIVPGGSQGLFFQDTRVLSRLELRVDGTTPEALAATSTDPFSAVHMARLPPGADQADSSVVVVRERYIGRGMREDIRLRNFAEQPAHCLVELVLGADFADLFEVKEGRADPGGDDAHGAEEVDGALVFRARSDGRGRGLRVDFSHAALVTADRATFEVVVPARGDWSLCVQCTPNIDGADIAPLHRCGQPVERASPQERLARWRHDIPVVETDHDGLRRTVARSVEDLGALRIFDPDEPERTVVAAGAPWFMTLFGRDSLLTSWMALLVDPDLALGVLQTLARFQGSDVDPRYEEEPGRILHEMRFGSAPSLSLGGGQVYYGTVDATPLFVMLLGELRRWGLSPQAVDELLPHADRALQWIEQFGDRDGDGYVEYQRVTDRGLANQGWKDSGDGIRYADGTVAGAPIALCEVQGYVYAAYLARAYFAQEAGDQRTADRYRKRAAALRRAFNRDFWLEDKGWFAVGLGPDKRPIDSLTSNIGHCLWTGIVDEEKAPLVAERLLSPEMFSGWGLRTLASSMGGFNPISYHCGSVWPHDSAIVAAGLMRYGFVEQAQRVVMGLLDAAVTQSGRLPELYGGFDRSEFPTVVGYPTSCSPQAWAAASPLLCLRTLLRFDPWVPHGKLWVDAALPDSIGYLRVDHIPLAGGRVSVTVEDGRTEVHGLSPELRLITSPRQPSTAA